MTEGQVSFLITGLYMLAFAIAYFGTVGWIRLVRDVIAIKRLSKAIKEVQKERISAINAIENNLDKEDLQ